jgi:hypothetical protein
MAGTALFVFILAPTPAEAQEITGGVNVGGLLAGAVPHLAVSPNAGISWSAESGIMLAAHDAVSILPPMNGTGVGVYNHTTIAIGHAGENVNWSAGPSLAVYSMASCGSFFCGRVAGLAPGVNARADLFFSGPLGVSLSANVDWVSGSSLVLRGGLAAMVVVGPVFRWNSR